MIVGRYAAVLDACVLHPSFARGALLWMAAERLFRPLWSERILVEWERSLLRRFPDQTAERLAPVRQQMLDHFEDAMVTGHEPLAAALVATLPDPNDVHVLAAAIVGRADAIITANRRDFPAEAVSPYRLEITHPDDFIVAMIDLAPERAVSSLRRHRGVLQKPPLDAHAFVDKFAKTGLVQSAARLRTLTGLL